ncbi:MAG: hypothetical protein ABI607_05645 [Betaproteobacteria bacterium]
MLDWLVTPRLRPALTVLGLAGLLTLEACGGGSGAPNNPYVDPPSNAALQVLPTTLTAYSGIPVTVTVVSGVAPYSVFTSNASVLPVTQNVAGNTIVLLPNKVTTDTEVTITVQDAAAQTAIVRVTVSGSPILNALTFAPSGGDCGANLCSGQTGTATVVATGPGGVPLSGRQIRFDVVSGPFGITTSNPATPLVQTLTVSTDSTGTAVVSVLATANSPTQPAQIRATDVTSGQQQIANFTIVNSTVAGQSPLTVIPETATITGALTTSCSSGFRIDYFIYGGTPPYRVSSTFPTGVTIVNTTVPVSGGFFEAITNGACVDPLTFTIVDTAGKQTTATLINKPGTTAPPAPSAISITPATVTDIACAGKTYSFIVNGGTPPYNVTQVTNPTYAGTVGIAPPIVPAAGGTVAITYTGPPVPAGTATTVAIVDGATPPQTISAKINCN